MGVWAAVFGLGLPAAFGCSGGSGSVPEDGEGASSFMVEL
jgi:hypothetical protein